MSPILSVRQIISFKGEKATLMRFAILAAILLFPVTASVAQAAAPPSAANSAPHFFVSLRERTNATQWFAAADPAIVYGHQDSLLRFGLTQRIHSFEYLFDLQQASELFLPTDAVSPIPAQGQLGLGGTYYAANGNNSFPAAFSLRQAFARFYFQPAKSNLRLGRFEFVEGQEMTPSDSVLLWLQNNRIAHHIIGNFGFSNAQRSFDGGTVRFGGANWDLTFMGARATQGVFNMNTNPEINVDTQYLAFTHYLGKKHVLVRVFADGYHDGRTQITKTDNRPAAVRAADHENIRLGTFGGSMIATIPAGKNIIDAVFWGAGQTGRWGLLSHGAGAFTAEGGFRATELSWKPWLRAGIWRSTGDSNNADSSHHTFFTLLNTPRIYARFPFFNPMNLTDEFVQAIANPSSKLEFRSDLHGLKLTQSSDLWYTGGGPFDNTVFGVTGRPGSPHGRSLATLADISADYEFNTQISLAAHYSHAFGRTTVASIYPAVTGSNYGYFELNYKLDKPFGHKSH